MVKKTHKADSDAGNGAAAAAAASPLAGMVKESASQIWLAGLGAFAKAQEEGGKVFDALVKEGLSLQRKTQASAEEKISEATGKMASMATDISSRASGQWDKLENIFEERVARSMNRLGAPSAKDYADLVARVERLERERGTRAPTSAPRVARARAAAPAGEAGAARPARKRAARKAT
jgi:poly(hydroxyalkanoate) granule-associated protein